MQLYSQNNNFRSPSYGPNFLEGPTSSNKETIFAMNNISVDINYQSGGQLAGEF